MNQWTARSLMFNIILTNPGAAIYRMKADVSFSFHLKLNMSFLSIHLGSNACDLVKAATNVCKREWPRSLTLARMQCKINQVACSIEGHQNVFVYDSKLRTVNASIQV